MSVTNRLAQPSGVPERVTDKKKTLNKLCIKYKATRKEEEGNRLSDIIVEEREEEVSGLSEGDCFLI